MPGAREEEAAQGRGPVGRAAAGGQCGTGCQGSLRTARTCLPEGQEVPGANGWDWEHLWENVPAGQLTEGVRGGGLRW